MTISDTDLVAFNKFGLELDGIETTVLSIAGFGGTIKSHVLQAVDKQGKAATLNFIANPNIVPQDIVATRPMYGNSDWYDWFAACAKGESDGKKNGSVHFYAAGDESPKMSFNFTGALCTTYQIAGTDAGSDGLTTEMVTFSMETLEKA